MNPGLAKIIPVISTLLKKKSGWASLLVLLALGVFFGGDFNSSIDWMWKEPRDLLVDRVEDARDSQQDAAEEFRDALSEFKAVVGTAETELEKRYKRLNRAFERSQQAALDINNRVDRVVNASNRLLEEWRGELDAYNDPQLRQLAEQQFDDTRAHATRLIDSMRQIERRMEPVLASFQDQVLYLKHNMNLAAIASLEGEAAAISTNVDELIADMNRSIAEADSFIQSMLDSAS